MNLGPLCNNSCGHRQLFKQAIFQYVLIFKSKEQIIFKIQNVHIMYARTCLTHPIVTNPYMRIITGSFIATIKSSSSVSMFNLNYPFPTMYKMMTPSLHDKPSCLFVVSIAFVILNKVQGADSVTVIYRPKYINFSSNNWICVQGGLSNDSVLLISRR